MRLPERLHHVLQVGAGGLQATSAGEPVPELAFAPFARDRMPAGLDADAVIAIAQNFLSDAQAAELETEAAA